MLSGADTVIQMCKLYRNVILEGRLGGGKSALAYRLAIELVETGAARYILSNCPGAMCDNPNDVLPRVAENGTYCLDAVFILDEAGQFIRFGKDTKVWQAFLRKANCYVFFPSAIGIPRNLQQFHISRRLDLRAFGLDVWLYSSWLSSAKRDRINFAWFRPSEIFGQYDTAAYPVGDCGLSTLLQEYTALNADISAEQMSDYVYRGKRDRSAGGSDSQRQGSTGAVVSRVEAKIQYDGVDTLDTDTLSAIADSIGTSVEDIEETLADAVQFTKSKRR